MPPLLQKPATGSIKQPGSTARPSGKPMLPKATLAQAKIGKEPSDLEKRKQQRLQRERAQQEAKAREKMHNIMGQQRSKEKDMAWDEEARTMEELTPSMAAITQ